MIVRIMELLPDGKRIKCQPVVYDPETDTFSDSDYPPIVALNLRGRRSSVPVETHIVVDAEAGHKTGAAPLYVCQV